MRIANVKVFDQPKPEDWVPGFSGFMLVGKKLIDQLALEQDQIRVGTLEKSRIQKPKLVTPTLTQMRNVLFSVGTSMTSEQRLDKLIDYYNYLRPDELKLHQDDYKKFVEDLAFYQMQKLYFYYGILPCEGVVGFMDELDDYGTARVTLANAPVIIAERFNLEQKDIYMHIIVDFLMVLDDLMVSLNQKASLHCYGDELHVNLPAEKLYKGFDSFIVNLFKHYEIESKYFPTLMSPRFKNFHLMTRLVNDVAFHNRYLDGIESLVESVLSELTAAYYAQKYHESNDFQATYLFHLRRVSDQFHSAVGCEKDAIKELYEIMTWGYESVYRDSPCKKVK